MAEAVLDNPRVLAGFNQEGCGAVGQTVEGQSLGERGSPDGGIEHAGGERPPQRSAGGPGEHEVVPRTIVMFFLLSG